MEYELLSNAVNSLRIGLSFYRKYINLENHYCGDQGNLKMTIICIQHATELFLKRLLSDVNELLIIEDFKKDSFLKLYAGIIDYREKYKTKVPLFHYLNGEHIIHTIKYEDLIERCTTIYNFDVQSQGFLKDLGRYRNKLMHMGINKQIDFYEVLLTINGTLRLLEDLIPKIKPYYNSEKKCLNGIYKRIDDIINLSLPLISDSWEAYWSECFEDMENSFIDLENDTDFTEVLYKYNLKMTIDWGNYRPSTFFKITFISLINDKRFVLLTENMPEHCVTLFKCPDLEEKVYYIYCHKYISDDDQKETNFIVLTEAQDKNYNKFWIDIPKDKKKNLRFSFDALKRELTELISKEIVKYMSTAV